MPQLVSGVVVEQVGDDVLVVVPGTTEALRLSGEAAKTVLTIQAGESVSSSDPVVGELVARGVVEVPGLSRRGLIRAGAVGAGAGIAVLAMPSVAAASSVVDLDGFAYFELGAPSAEEAEFAGGEEDDLYILVFVDHGSSSFPPAVGAEGTVTSSEFLGSRRAIHFGDGIWLAPVSGPVTPPLPTTGTFELVYPGVSVTGEVVDQNSG
jgi:hypothetical protein